MSASGDLPPIETRLMVRPGGGDDEWSVERIVEQTLKIQRCMEAVMKRDEHYGVIPGTGGRDGRPAKPTLLKPGAEKLCLMFRLCPEYETLRAEQSSALISYTIRCRLTHIPTGNLVATGLGSCNSREKKYTRPAAKVCPHCSKTTIFKSKNEGEGWYCWRKKDGCGATFKPEDPTIVNQDTGVEDPSDLDNTILKMACKRALVAAVLNGTAASDCFTQDLEDLSEKAAEYIPPPVKEEAKATAPKGTSPQAGTNATARTASAPATGTMPTNGQAPPVASTPGTPKDYVPANKVPVAAGDPPIAAGQVQRIHVLVEQCLDDQTYRFSWLKPYRNHEGKSAESSKDLTFDQAANLIKRLTAHAQRQDVRTERMKTEGPENLAAVVGPAPAKAAQKPRVLSDELQRVFSGDDDESVWLHGLFGVSHAKELDRDQSETALQLLISWGTPLYDKAIETATAMGKIR